MSTRKKSGACKSKVKKSKEVGKIMQTTDGYFSGNKRNSKKRNVVVLAQRKDDGALAVLKLHKKEQGKKHRIPNLELLPDRHPALKEITEVEKRVYISTGPKGKKRPIYKRDVTDTGDKLTRKEKRAIKRGAGGSTRKNKKTSKRTLRKWKKHFKSK